MRTTIPEIATPHRHVIESAIAGEVGHWRNSRENGTGWRYFLDPNESYTGVTLFSTGRVRVAGRLADKVAHIPGGTPFSHVGYEGLQWTVN